MGLIRLATPADINHIQTIELAARGLFPAERLPSNNRPIATRTLSQGIDDGLLWVLTEDNQTRIGFVLASRHDTRLHLEELDMRPDHMRKGYGTALVNHVIDYARLHNYAAITLTTFKDFPWNAPFYQRLGFSPVTQHTTHSLLESILIKEALLGLQHRVGMILFITPHHGS